MAQGKSAGIPLSLWERVRVRATKPLAASQQGDSPSRPYEPPAGIATAEARRDSHRRSSAWGLFLLLASALVVYWAGNARTPLWDRDEPRFAEAAREMLATGDFVVPRFNEQLRADKPILGYYPIVVGMKIFGVNEFGARAFSGILGLLTVLAMYFLARRILVRSDMALAAAAILAFSPVMVVESKLCTVDALLFLLLILTFTGLWRIYEGPCRWGWKALFWSTLSLAVLTKGPVALAAVFMPVVIIALLARDRSFLRRFGWLWGVPLFVAIALPWAIAVQKATSGEFLRIALGKHVVGRSVGVLEGHKGFPGFYIATLFATFFPWIYFLPGSIKMFVKGLDQSTPTGGFLKRLRDGGTELFLFAWAIGLLIVLELVQTKMIHYALPVFPALSMIVVLFANRACDVKFKTRCARSPAVAALTAALFVVVGGPVWAWYEGLTAAVWPFAVSGAILVIGMALWVVRAPNWANHLPIAGAVAAWLFAVSAIALPQIGGYGPSKEVANLVQRAFTETEGALVRPTKPEVVLFGYDEPSLVFYLDPTRVRVQPMTVDRFMYRNDVAPRVMVISDRQTEALRLFGKPPYRKVGTACGFNFANGRHEEVSVWAAGD